jgi:choline dehydrogenase
MPDQGYDYVIVGAGAAGCVLAARLSEGSAARVLLVESGGSDKGWVTRIPLLTYIASATASRNWSFVTEPIPALHGRRQTWNQGRLIGGSSSINGMIYMRGSPKEYDDWQRAGCEGWAFDELLSYFKKSEGNSRGEGPWHGGSGPVKVRPSNLNLPICDAFLEAVQGAGFPVVEDLNAGVSEGFGRFDCNIDNGIRMSSARAYLHPAYKRENLTVLENASARRVIIRNGRAAGVEVLYHGERRIFHAAEEVILCGGALNSPVLLMASGIGPADHLAEMGIPILVDSSEVGGNLRNHAAYFQQYHCTARVTAHSYLSPLSGAKACFDYAYRRTGPFAESFSGIGGFIRSDASVEFSDTIVVMVPSLLNRPNGNQLRWRDLLPRENGFFAAISLGRPHSVGRIRLRSGIPGDAPRIFPNYFDDARDMAALVKSVQSVRRAMQRDCIARYIDVRGDQNNFSDAVDAIEQSIRATAGSLSHPGGTCRMGSDALAVVDPQLRVNGIAGLRVADNSIMPQALNACPHAAALMIGEKASALITGRP